jgi:hypothetical protein
MLADESTWRPRTLRLRNLAGWATYGQGSERAGRSIVGRRWGRSGRGNGARGWRARNTEVKEDSSGSRKRSSTDAGLVNARMDDIVRKRMLVSLRGGRGELGNLKP